MRASFAIPINVNHSNLWRASLLALGCAAVAKNRRLRFFNKIAIAGFGSATHSSGSKLPRHKGG
ncbi:hypothetical protein OC71_14230 [Pseudomonas sp. W15Feb9B]|nr:hypothetical protein OC71_14230 [Pseudomonas sp. W15Feb9B]